MINNNADPTPNPSPTWEGKGYRVKASRTALPSHVGEGPGVGSVT